MKSNYKLGEDQSSIKKSILHPYEMWTTNDQVHFLLWLACIFTSSLLAWEYKMWEYHLNSNDLLSFGCCLLARSTLLISSTKYLKFSLDHHFVCLPSHAQISLKGRHPTLGEVTSFQRTILDTHLKCIIWLIHWMNSTWSIN